MFLNANRAYSFIRQVRVDTYIWSFRRPHLIKIQEQSKLNEKLQFFQFIKLAWKAPVWAGPIKIDTSGNIQTRITSITRYFLLRSKHDSIKSADRFKKNIWNS